MIKSTDIFRKTNIFTQRPLELNSSCLKTVQKDTFQISSKTQPLCKIKQTENSISLLDETGNTLSEAILMEEGPNALCIMDISSQIQGKGYGTKIINTIKEKYPNHTINLTAEWERGLGHNPPHAFYMRNGFVPENKNAFEALTKWINNGAKANEFPMQYELCPMKYTPQN